MFAKARQCYYDSTYSCCYANICFSMNRTKCRCMLKCLSYRARALIHGSSFSVVCCAITLLKYARCWNTFRRCLCYVFWQNPKRTSIPSIPKGPNIWVSERYKCAWFPLGTYFLLKKLQWMNRPQNPAAEAGFVYKKIACFVHVICSRLINPKRHVPAAFRGNFAWS